MLHAVRAGENHAAETPGGQVCTAENCRRDTHNTHSTSMHELVWEAGARPVQYANAKSYNVASIGLFVSKHVRHRARSLNQTSNSHPRAPRCTPPNHLQHTAHESFAW